MNEKVVGVWCKKTLDWMVFIAIPLNSLTIKILSFIIISQDYILKVLKYEYINKYFLFSLHEYEYEYK